MKYFVLLAGYGEMPAWEELSPEEQEEGMAQHFAFAEACEARSVEIVSSHRPAQSRRCGRRGERT